jgi:hypothetical protein
MVQVALGHWRFSAASSVRPRYTSQSADELSEPRMSQMPFFEVSISAGGS